MKKKNLVIISLIAAMSLAPGSAMARNVEGTDASSASKRTYYDHVSRDYYFHAVKSDPFMSEEEKTQKMAEYDSGAINPDGTVKAD